MSDDIKILLNNGKEISLDEISNYSKSDIIGITFPSLNDDSRLCLNIRFNEKLKIFLIEPANHIPYVSEVAAFYNNASNVCSIIKNLNDAFECQKQSNDNYWLNGYNPYSEWRVDSDLPYRYSSLYYLKPDNKLFKI